MSMQDILENICPQSVMLTIPHVIQLNVAKAKNQQLSQVQLCNSHIFCHMYTLQCIFICNSAALSAFCPTTLHCVLGNFEELSSDSNYARS
jgi:hypothetical protein